MLVENRYFTATAAAGAPASGGVIEMTILNRWRNLGLPSGSLPG
jgi:hypothetical protein